MPDTSLIMIWKVRKVEDKNVSEGKKVLIFIAPCKGYLCQ